MDVVVAAGEETAVGAEVVAARPPIRPRCGKGTVDIVFRVAVRCLSAGLLACTTLSFCGGIGVW
ncbi:hypothetical protein ACFQL0_06415 [Haloplanus litoreus]|uniref:Uncharacterized protein n=1 Tax=Haloplanus litoreus TaxID=767515 RepID=A0ABD6A1P9_9EURY